MCHFLFVCLFFNYSFTLLDVFSIQIEFVFSSQSDGEWMFLYAFMLLYVYLSVYNHCATFDFIHFSKNITVIYMITSIKLANNCSTWFSWHDLCVRLRIVQITLIHVYMYIYMCVVCVCMCVLVRDTLIQNIFTYTLVYDQWNNYIHISNYFLYFYRNYN